MSSFASALLIPCHSSAWNTQRLKSIIGIWALLGQLLPSASHLGEYSYNRPDARPEVEESFCKKTKPRDLAKHGAAVVRVGGHPTTCRVQKF
ncbi:hypothetical protein B0T26DRAFT_688358 [Lasiosphaeria miniovina]|uniref:Uncharacterized protein n=1 Tax=Lasiosphaeria miniovina TaxID=1954250 RepID=A0AA40BI11_9PEZI|nr:uncharacterized protein B0T26DRAFT_688358 [Lasiosphaeria miniovina]KAK0734408.1 hypothetical protein B0T26DRAFT_688358 [Lasiosphaeria miniovina]